MEWLTYELKKKIIIVGGIVAALCSAIGIAGVYVTAEVTTRADGSKQIDAGPFAPLLVIGLLVLMILIVWYHTISKRRGAIKAGVYKPLHD
jgi:amino acid transporter